jgi:hypothetical protein
MVSFLFYLLSINAASQQMMLTNFRGVLLKPNTAGGGADDLIPPPLPRTFLIATYSACVSVLLTYVLYTLHDKRGDVTINP